MFVCDFKEFSSSGVESIFDYIEDKPYKNQRMIADYLFGGKTLGVTPTKVKDVVAGKYTPYTKEIHCDEEYEWSTEIAYHVMERNLRLPDFFEKHVLSKLGLSD